MAIYLDRVKPFKLYKSKFFTPINKNNKRHGSCIYLLTPDYESTIKNMTHPLMHNLDMFRSYYMERNINFFIRSTNEAVNEELDLNFQLDYSTIVREPVITEGYYMDKENLIFFNESSMSNEKAINSRLRNLMYTSRIRNRKQLEQHYTKVKKDCPIIKFAYPKIERYKRRNLFVDMSYYMSTFFRVNRYQYDRGVELLYTLFSRFLLDERFGMYNKKTVLVPVNDWCQNIPLIKLFRTNNAELTPINLLVRLYEKFKPQLELWRDVDFIFITQNGYFTMSINDLLDDSRAMSKFMQNIKYLVKRMPIEEEIREDEEEISTEVIDRLEKKTKLTFNTIKSDIKSKINFNVSRSKNDTKVNFAPQNSTVKRFGGTTPSLANRVVNKVITPSAKEEKEEVKKIIKQVKEKQPKPVVPTKDTINKDIVKIKNKTEESKKTAEEKVADKVKEIVKNNPKDMNAIEKAMDNDDELKLLILNAAEEQRGIKISTARKKRAEELHDKFIKKEIHGKPIKEIIETPHTELTNKAIPQVESIDNQWNNLKKISFEDDYDLSADIIKCINAFSDKNKSVPMNVVDLSVEDISNSEDYIVLYNVQYEDVLGKRHRLKFEVPKIVNKRFMRLRGNDKIMNGQLVNLPVIKTGEDTVQIVTNYNKVTVKYFGRKGKATLMVNALNKVIDKIVESDYKYTEKKPNDIVKVLYGTNKKICNKYSLPIDYIDLASIYNKIILRDGTIIYFNQDEIRQEINEKNLKIDDTTIPVAIIKRKGKDAVESAEPEFLVNRIYDILSFNNEEFQEKSNIYLKYNASKTMYSAVKIMGVFIPVIVVMAYSVGLTEAMRRADIQYEITEQRPTDTYNYIRFKDGFLRFSNDLDESLLMSGLREFDIANYSIVDIDTKSMWLDVLDNFGGRIKADGLENFYNLMIDPITAEVCKQYKLPTDYITLLAYASSLLSENEFNKHVDITGNRYRTNERIAHFVYKALATSYEQYLQEVRNNRKDAKMTIKQGAVIDLTLGDVTTSDASKLNPLLELENANSVTFKGLAGMNKDRSYQLDKRIYDKSMINKLSMSTGASANVGINRQATINMNINTTKGYINANEDEDINNMNDVNTLCITEAITPFGVTHDDPFRTAMTFIQTAKHSMAINDSDPLLVTNGADQALAYMTPDTFAHKAKFPAVVVEKTDSYMILQDRNNPKKTEFVDLRERVEKNSDAGFFITIKLDTKYKKGDVIKKGEVVAYDKKSYSDTVGVGNLSYNVGALTKVAIIHTDEGFEDSAIISDELSKKMGSEILMQIDVLLDKSDIILNRAKVGQDVQEGDKLLVYQSSFDEDDANKVLTQLSLNDNKDSDIGKIVVKAETTGVLQDIKVYRTIDFKDMSPSLARFVKEYETPINETKKVIEKYNVSNKAYDPAGVLPATGKLKHAEDKVLIEFYIKYFDNMGIGDKLVYYSALKGVIKDIFPKGEEPYSEFRPDEKVNTLLPIHSINARMVGSVLLMAGLNKVLIELDRSVKDIFGIKWK